MTRLYLAVAAIILCVILIGLLALLKKVIFIIGPVILIFVIYRLAAGDKIHK